MRFITEDTNRGDVKDPLSLNLYVYCQGNPITLVDIDGHAGRNVQSLINQDGLSLTGAGGEAALIVFDWLVKEGETIVSAFRIAYESVTTYFSAVNQGINVHAGNLGIKLISAEGSGTHNRRTFDVTGTKVRINCGHGYDRNHRTSKNMQSIGTRDEIEEAILLEVRNLMNPGYKFSAKNCKTMQITINGRKFDYNIIQFENSTISISTCF